MFIWKNKKVLSYYSLNFIQKPLTLKTLQAGNQIALNKVGSPNTITCFYSLNNSQWTAYNPGAVITLQNVGDQVSFRCTSTNLSKSTADYYQFSTTKNFEVFGNIMSLVQGNRVLKNLKTIQNDFQFCILFRGCSKLVNINNLKLPATTLSQSCYRNIFRECASLTTIPQNLLHATTLTNNCYEYMFWNCTSLTTIPAGLLPATTLATNCYYGMFEYCIKLTTIPANLLPATTLVSNCYNQMFANCTTLSSITVNFTEWNDAGTATNLWLSGVAAYGEFTKPAALSAIYDESHIPNGWNVINK